jgi:hypothetical protein
LDVLGNGVRQLKRNSNAATIQLMQRVVGDGSYAAGTVSTTLNRIRDGGWAPGINELLATRSAA